MELWKIDTGWVSGMEGENWNRFLQVATLGCYINKHGKAFYLCRKYMDFGEEMFYHHLNQKMTLVAVLNIYSWENIASAPVSGMNPFPCNLFLLPPYTNCEDCLKYNFIVLFQGYTNPSTLCQ